MSEILEIRNEHLTVTASTLGAELQSVTSAGGTEFLWYGDKAIWPNRAPLLFPICSGLKNDTYTYGGRSYTMKKHGFGKFREFSGEKLDDRTLCFTLRADEETKAQYPFDFVLRVLYTLEGNTIHVRYEIENPADTPLYCSIGAHEAYYCPEGIEQYAIAFDAPQTLNSFFVKGGVLTRDSECIAENTTHLPLKQEFFADKSLIFRDLAFHKAALVHSGSRKRITVEFPDATYFVVWTIPGAPYICLEPWNGITDVEGSGYALSEKEGILCIAPGQTRTISHSITFAD